MPLQSIKEEFLYYIWKTQQFDQSALQTINGEEIKIEKLGFQNHHSGPDFSDAIIKIGEVVWAGNVEMHIYSSDWVKHKHQCDDAYQNVILHVVYEHDKDIVFYEHNVTSIIPTLELKKFIPQHIINRYSEMLQSKAWIACQSLIREVNPATFQFWKYNLAVERLWRKTDYVQDLLHNKGKDWEEVLYISIARYFGAKANTLAFEQLALATPLKIIHKNLYSPLAVNALLFGQSGLLVPKIEDDPYYHSLQQEYLFLQSKYGLLPMNPSVWKFGRMMPPGFPTFRIAQLAALLLKVHAPFSQLLEARNVIEIYQMFDGVVVAPYWEEHYRFGASSKTHTTNLTKEFMDRLIINSLLPLLFTYGKAVYDESICDRAIAFLEQLPKESNTVIKHWNSCGLKAENALDTQSLLHLKEAYCQQLRCAQCHIGHKLLASP